MSMKATVSLELELDIFQMEEVRQAEQRADAASGTLYCWKTSGIENWLESGLSISDVLALVVLPKGLPDVIDMPDDAPDYD